jgi:hypothetical protein
MVAGDDAKVASADERVKELKAGDDHWRIVSRTNSGFLN